MARFIRLSFSSEKTGFAGRAAEKYSPTRPTGGEVPKTKGSIMEFENQIEPVIQETTDLIDLQTKIEDSREKTKERLSLNDEEFDQLIKNFIIDCFAKLHIKISTDDPILAVILSQKNVMEYYSTLITESLHAIPKQIGDVIDAKLQEKLDELSAGIGKALEVIDDAGTEMHTAFSKSVLDLNNQVITSLDSFSNKKIEEIKKSFESVQPQKSQAKSEVLNKSKNPLLWILTGLIIINIAVSGFILTNSKQPEKDKETAYQVGLYKGFEEVKKIAPKEADKIQKIIISNIDNELKSK